MYKIFCQRYSQILVLTGCTASLGLILVGRKYIDRYRIYNTISIYDGKPVFCDEYMHKLLLEVGKKMDIAEEDLKRIIVYYTSFDAPIFKGCLKSPINSWLPEGLIPNAGIGLPKSYYLMFLDETSFDKFIINKRTLDIKSDSSDGIQFRRQLLLSEEAKKFILARQLYYLSSNIDIIRNCATVATVYVFYQTVFFLPRFYKVLATLTAPYRIFIYAGIAGILFLAKRELVESYMLRVHYAADRVALVDPQLYVGALEFYEKLIKRNKMLHRLGFSGQFNKLGNEESGLLFNYHVINSHVRLSRLMNPRGAS